MKKILLALALLPALCWAQDDKVAQTFRDTRVVNGHSVETSPAGEMKFIISHRFGTVNSGVYELWGLDNSNIRIGLDYGITDWLTVGAGRSSFEKTYDGFLKARLLHQKDGENSFPFSLTAQSAIAVNTLKWANPDRENLRSSRYFYTHQLLFARKFSDAFSLQLMPTVVHRNMVATAAESNDVFAMGAASRYQLTQMLSVQFEYYYMLPDQLMDENTNSFSIGFDIDTKGHVFQLHLSNTRGMTEKFFVTNTRGDWLDGDIHIGFNITRDFRLKGRKY